MASIPPEALYDHRLTPARDRFNEMTIGDQLRYLHDRLDGTITGEFEVHVDYCFAHLHVDKHMPAYGLVVRECRILQWNKRPERRMKVVEAIAMIFAAQPGDGEKALASLA